MKGPLARYHGVLSAVAASGDGLTAVDLAKKASLPRSTAHRIAAALCEVGYLQQTNAGIYVLGPALDEIVGLRLVATQNAGTFLPVLQGLVADLQETAFCARLIGGRVEIVEAVAPLGRERSHIFPGLGYRPLEKCSSSKAILAFRSPSEVKGWLESEAGIDLNVSVDREAFRVELAAIRTNGYAICDGEIDEGVFSIACPIFLEPFGALNSIGITGPSARIKAMPIDDVVCRVRGAAEEATTRIVAAASAKASMKTRQ